MSGQESQNTTFKNFNEFIKGLLVAEAHDLLVSVLDRVHADFESLDRSAQLIRGKVAVALGHRQRACARHRPTFLAAATPESPEAMQ